MKKFFTSMMLVCAAVMGMQAQTNVWILGNVGDQDVWDPSVGTLMTYNEADGAYELTADFHASSYFSFTTALAENSSAWDAIKPYRFGAPANNYEITDDLLGEPIACGDYGESSDNAFLITQAATYKITLLLSDDGNLVMFERIGDVIPDPDPVDEGHIYIMGAVNGNAWATNVGVQMTELGNNMFSANVNIAPAEGEEVAYFGFTHALAVSAQNWAAVAPFRFAAVDEASQAIVVGEPTALSADGAGDLSFCLPAGKYIFNLDMNARTLTVTVDESNHMYIIGNNPFGNWTPEAGMAMDEVEAGVFTATATFEGDVWFIFSSENAGWDAVNANRYGPVAEATEDQVIAVGEEVTTQLTTSDKSYKITGDGSEYTITFDLNNLVFKFEAAGTPSVPGDVNGDGTVDVADMNSVINVMLGMESNDAADINGDGNVDVADLSAVINFMIGM